jgi:glycosyltransferase involved in cell wall biosynthesis
VLSIIIPAHNEASVIRRCGQAILQEAFADEVELVVVCNGCTDNTASRARDLGKNVKVIETDTPSKANALNLGDRLATGYPRFYIDADVVVPMEAIRQTAQTLQQKGVCAAAPAMHVDLSGRPWAIRAFYQVWLQLPYCQDGMIGSGVYALNEAGRQRFTDFPAITADDGFVRLLFKPHERVTVPTAFFTIFPPKTLRGLINIKTRAFFGALELKKLYPELLSNENTIHSGALRKLCKLPSCWGPLFIYSTVRAISRTRALYRFYSNRKNHWDRDHSSR